MGETFFDGRESVTDEQRSGRPVTSRTKENIVTIRQILSEIRRMTVRNIAEQVNIDRTTVRKILTEDLDMRKVCAKMVPLISVIFCNYSYHVSMNLHHLQGVVTLCLLKVTKLLKL